MEEAKTTRAKHFTSGKMLARNTVWNLVGYGVPTMVAAVCIPVLIRSLGKERFGVLTLAWALVGYASLFDMGLGRALTQLVARKLGEGREEEIPETAWTSLVLMMGLGIVGAAAVIAVAPWLAGRWLNVPEALRGETLWAFRLLGISVPFVITTAGLRGLLEAHQRFELTNALRIPFASFGIAGPLLALPFSKSLAPAVAILVAGRIALWAAYLVTCLRAVPELRRKVAWRREAAGPLLRFGGWMTVSNIIGPLMVTMDRFVIGAMVSMTAVAYYTTPYEFISKFWLLPGAVMTVMFPAFSTSFAQDRERAALLFGRSVKLLFLVLFPVMLCAITFAQDGLKLWLGFDFAQHSFRVLQWLAAGVFINSLAQVAFGYLQSVGRSDQTAKLHLIELPLYLLALRQMVRLHGIEGAAIAWTGRTFIESLILFGLSGRFLPTGILRKPQKNLLQVFALFALATATLPQSFLLKGVFLFLVIPCFIFVFWFFILTPEERTLAQDYR